MPAIKVDLPQEVLEKLATLANRHMVATRVMAGDVIAAYLSAAQQSAQADLPTRCPECGEFTVYGSSCHNALCPTASR